ncbi:DEAD/DEAH box helicase family protein [Microvirga mediterraneensis]|uniref:AAA family ATPase n=1 Tax=Microvirga mediterraneensis TaxID=2754695 RepID=A0A838BUT9_9HYPH|nr:DEAD/DEAH box helicase family protein [Microvirga mediterraneensis]MBA1158675.1 AAA family ATPase [Microvirga mediterraneensis]
MSTYNQTVLAEADKVARAAQQDFFQIRGEGAVTLSAIAGAGKTYFVTDTVRLCRRQDIRVAVAAPTNEQVYGLVRSIAESEPNRPVAFVPAQGVELPAWAARPNVQIISPAHQATGDAVVVGTIDKLGSARNPRRSTIPRLGTFDALIMDESFQANAGRYLALADIAPRHLCVGDSGQINPFTTVDAGTQWRGLSEDPLQTAVDVLHSNHPGTPAHRFPITRRLDGRGAAVAKCFYPRDHVFGAAVADGVRQMKLTRSSASDLRTRALDEGLALAAKGGWAHLELPARQTLVCDPDTGQVIADLVSRLLARSPVLVCERNPDGTKLLPERIAVGVSHNDQKGLVRTLLDRAGLGRVIVDTANKLQGREFDISICWHPMAGLDEADEFHLESGRLCVMCTRHRHACFVIGRAGDRELLEGLPPATPAWPGADLDRVLTGWEVHQSVFSALEPFRVTVP